MSKIIGFLMCYTPYMNKFFNYTNGEVIVPNTAKVIKQMIVTFLVLIILLGSFTIVSVGEVGIVLRAGSLNRTLNEGLHIKIPLIESVEKITVRTIKIEVPASAASNDLQVVTSQIAIQFNVIPDQVSTLYRNLGKNYRSKVVDPAIQDAIKETTAQFTAEELITKREQVSNQVETILKERLFEEGIFVSNVDIVSFEFSSSFNAAIEAKVTAEQKALEAENKLKQVEFEAKQKVETAKAEAEAIRIQAQAINSRGGEDYVNLKAIEKWNGVLQTQFVPGNAIPFINL